MPGAYCMYCGQRCFVLRVIPGGERRGKSLHMATCPPGMRNDREKTGHTHETAVNPVTEPEAMALVLAGREVPARAIAEETVELVLPRDYQGELRVSAEEVTPGYWSIWAALGPEIIGTMAAGPGCARDSAVLAAAAWVRGKCGRAGLVTGPFTESPHPGDLARVTLRRA